MTPQFERYQRSSRCITIKRLGEYIKKPYTLGGANIISVKTRNHNAEDIKKAKRGRCLAFLVSANEHRYRN